MGNTPLEKYFEEAWQKHGNDEEEASDESPREDSSLESAQQQEVEIINVEEQGVEADISVPFANPTRKMHSQSSERPTEK